MTTFVSSSVESYVVRMKNTGTIPKYLCDANNGIGVVNYKWADEPNQVFSSLLSAMEFVENYLGVVRLNTPNVSENDMILFAQSFEIERTLVEKIAIQNL
jgi:hypothetical protein